MRLFPLAVDCDGSITAQQALCARLGAVVPFGDMGEALRLWVDSERWASVRDRVSLLHEPQGDPWLTFLGSGDYHHLTLA